jgi:membrane-associated protein
VSITSTIVDPVLNLNGLPAYALVAALAFAEAAAFVGFVLPGETAVILGGVLAYRHSVSLTLMIVVVVLAAILGDTVGYEVGKRYGKRVLGLSVFDRHRGAIDNASERLRTRGGITVFLARFTAFLRAVMPGLAGTAKMPYRRFLVWNAAGGILWGTGFTLLGYLAGASYTKIESYAGKFSDVILGLVVVALIVWFVHRRRAEREPVAADSTGETPGR